LGRIPLNCVIEGLEIDSVPSGSYCNAWSGWLNMLPIEFKPSLAECIETLAKREYEESLRNYLESPENNEELQEKIRLLRLFLESTDFRQLRAECEKRLSKGKSAGLILRLVNGEPEIKLIVE